MSTPDPSIEPSASRSLQEVYARMVRSGADFVVIGG